MEQRACEFCAGATFTDCVDLGERTEDHSDPSQRRQINRTLRGGRETALTVNQLPCHPLWEEEKEKDWSDDEEEENREEDKGSEEKPKTGGQVKMTPR